MLKLENGCSNTENDNRNESLEALKRIHEELNDIKTADYTVASEMNKVRIVCDAPPITPRCHVEEEPASPLLVSEAMFAMNTSNKDLQKELEHLHPGSAARSKRFEKDLEKMAEQAQELDLEISKLSALSSFQQISEQRYDKARILEETKKVEKLVKGLEKTRQHAQKEID